MNADGRRWEWIEPRRHRDTEWEPAGRDIKRIPTMRAMYQCRSSRHDFSPPSPSFSDFRHHLRVFVVTSLLIRVHLRFLSRRSPPFLRWREMAVAGEPDGEEAGAIMDILRVAFIG